jgi:hypothetical protein
VVASAIGNGSRLTAQSWAALREHRRLLVFPLVSGVLMVLASVAFVAAAMGTGVIDGLIRQDEDRLSPAIVGLIELFVFYLVCYAAVIFSGTALVGTVLRLADGQSATVGDGFRIALRRLPRIIVFALISATVGLLARRVTTSARTSNNIVVTIVTVLVGALVQGAWNLAVFFALPVMVAEELSVAGSLKRSLALFRQTWGETYTGQAVIGGIGCLAYLLVIAAAGLLGGVGVALDAPALIVAAIVVGFVLICALALLQGAVNGVFQASLYRYATTGDAGPLIDTSDAAAAFGTDGVVVA